MVQRSFIVNMLGAFQDRDNLYLVMDFLNGGDLRYHLNRKIIFDERQISTSVAYPRVHHQVYHGGVGVPPFQRNHPPRYQTIEHHLRRQWVL